jgi:hypothetical protein
MTAGRIRTPLVALAVCILLTLLAAPAPAHAQGSPTPPSSIPTTTLPVDLGPQGVIPLPNSGHKPESPGDPGGWEQLLLFGILATASAGIFGRVLWAARQHTKANQV